METISSVAPTEAWRLPSANLVKLGLLTQGEMALLEPTGEARDHLDFYLMTSTHLDFYLTSATHLDFSLDVGE